MPKNDTQSAPAPFTSSAPADAASSSSSSSSSSPAPAAAVARRPNPTEVFRQRAAVIRPNRKKASPPPPAPKPPPCKPGEKRAVELHKGFLETAEWQFRATAARLRWPVGVELTEADYQKAVSETVNARFGGM